MWSFSLFRQICFKRFFILLSMKQMIPNLIITALATLSIVSKKLLPLSWLLLNAISLYLSSFIVYCWLIKGLGSGYK